LFTDTELHESVRDTIQAIVDRPGNLVPPAAVGALDFDYRDVQNLAGPTTRQEFADLLQGADLDVATELPAVQNFQDDQNFLSHCLAEIVPTLQGTGIQVGDPNSFCALMHLERTGIMPRGVSQTLAAPAAVPEPVGAAAPPAAPVAQASDVPVRPPIVGLADGPSNVALAVLPGEPAADEILDDGGESESEDTDPVAAKVAEINDALDEANAAVDDLKGILGIAEEDTFANADKSLALRAKLLAVRSYSMADGADEAAIAEKVSVVDDALDAAESLVDELLSMLNVPEDEAFDASDKSMAMCAKLSAIRNFGMPAAPNDAGLPANPPTVPVSTPPHGIPGGALGVAAADVVGKDAAEKPQSEGKPELAPETTPKPALPFLAPEGEKPSAAAAVAAPCMGKPNKKKVVAACDMAEKPLFGGKQAPPFTSKS
jgi:hypothetical protein